MIKTLGKLLSNLDSKPVHSSSVEKSAPRSLWQRIGSTIKEPFAGAWQQNRELTVDDGLSYPVVFACVSRISEDLSKIAIRHERRDQYGIFKRVDSSKFSKLLKNPNLYQDRQKFIAYWESCIQSRGNAYIFKERTKGEVTSLHVLHPDMVTPLITATGAVYYQINISAAPNDLTGIKESQTLIAAA